MNILGNNMGDLKDVAVIIKTFNRPDKLELALKSLVGKGFGEVIVADDGERSQRKLEVYEKFREKIPLKVLELPYDSGLAFGRNEAVKASRSEYILVIDDDMTVNNVEILREVLEQNRNLGGVSGCLIERARFRCFPCNLDIRNGYLVKYDPPLEPRFSGGGVSYFHFDLIPNAAMFRREVFDDYSWDPHYKIGYEHLDFYLAHKKLEKWKFAVVPSVLFFHFPGGSRSYLSSYRFNKKRIRASYQYFLKKWGLKGVVSLNSGLAVPSFNRILLVKLKQSLPLPLASMIEKLL